MIFLSSFCGTELKPGKLSSSADGAAPAATVSVAAPGHVGRHDFPAPLAGGREKTGSDHSVPAREASRGYRAQDRPARPRRVSLHSPRLDGGVPSRPGSPGPVGLSKGIASDWLCDWALAEASRQVAAGA